MMVMVVMVLLLLLLMVGGGAPLPLDLRRHIVRVRLRRVWRADKGCLLWHGAGAAAAYDSAESGRVRGRNGSRTGNGDRRRGGSAPDTQAGGQRRNAGAAALLVVRRMVHVMMMMRMLVAVRGGAGGGGAELLLLLAQVLVQRLDLVAVGRVEKLGQELAVRCAGQPKGAGRRRL